MVASRYNNNPPIVGFIRNFGLKKGAIASSISHDSHNIIAVGVSDDDILRVVNSVIETKGGIAAGDADEIVSLDLEIAGLMSKHPVENVAHEYHLVDQKAKDLGCKLKAPFMTLSFMTLLVIPELKISDQCLFDVNNYKPTSLFV
jgi:adenine deaminase